MSGISLTRTTVLTAVAGVEVAVILFFVARWYSRRWGFRSTLGRIRRYVRATFVDLAAPAVQVYRYGRNVRQIATQLTDPELGGVLRVSTADSTARLAGEPDCRPYAVLLSRATVTVALTGWRPVPAQAPWHDRDGWWITPRSGLAPDLTPEMDDVPIGHVAVGAENGTLTLLDLMRAPGVIEVTGPDRTVGSLICAVAAQLSSGLTAFEPMNVIVAAGLHPRYSGPKPLAVLKDLDVRSRAADYGHPITMLFCGPLNPAESDLLTGLMPRLPNLRVMLAAPYAGRRWRLTLTETGRIEAPELGLSTDSSPVERGVARALKLRAEQPNSPQPQSRRPQAQSRQAQSRQTQLPQVPTLPAEPVSPRPELSPAFPTPAFPAAADEFVSPDTSSFFTQPDPFERPSGPSARASRRQEDPATPAGSGGPQEEPAAAPPNWAQPLTGAGQRSALSDSSSGWADPLHNTAADPRQSIGSANPAAAQPTSPAVDWAGRTPPPADPRQPGPPSPTSRNQAPTPSTEWAGNPTGGPFAPRPVTAADPFAARTPTAPPNSTTSSEWAPPLGAGGPTGPGPQYPPIATTSGAHQPGAPLTSTPSERPSASPNSTANATSAWAASPPRGDGNQPNGPAAPHNPTHSQRPAAATRDGAPAGSWAESTRPAPPSNSPASPSAWDLEEPEPISPPTGSMSVSAIKGRAAEVPDDAADPARR